MARIAIDRGGTFTDVICSRKGEDDIVFKVCLRTDRQLTISSYRSTHRTTAMRREKGKEVQRSWLTKGFAAYSVKSLVIFPKIKRSRLTGSSRYVWEPPSRQMRCWRGTERDALL
jgi:hypothetical protein